MTWKSNTFLRIIQLLVDYPTCLIVGADNVGSERMQQTRMPLLGRLWARWTGTPWSKALRGHLENRPALEKLVSHPGEGGLCLHQEGPPSLRSATCCWPVRCQLLPVLVPWPHVKSLCLPRTPVWAQEDPLLEVLVITTAGSRGTAELPRDMQLIETGDKVEPWHHTAEHAK